MMISALRSFRTKRLTSHLFVGFFLVRSSGVASAQTSEPPATVAPPLAEPAPELPPPTTSEQLPAASTGTQPPAAPPSGGPSPAPPELGAPVEANEAPASESATSGADNALSGVVVTGTRRAKRTEF